MKDTNKSGGVFRRVTTIDRRRMLAGIPGIGSILLAGCADIESVIGGEDGELSTDEGTTGREETDDDLADREETDDDPADGEEMGDATETAAASEIEIVDGPDTVLQGEAVEIGIEVTNPGETDAEATLELEIDGTVVDEWIGRVNVGDTRTVTLAGDGDETENLGPDTYDARVITYDDGVDVGSESWSFEVDEPIPTAAIVGVPDSQSLVQGETVEFDVEITNAYPTTQEFIVQFLIDEEERDEWVGRLDAFETHTVPFGLSGDETKALAEGTREVAVQFYDGDTRPIGDEAVADSVTFDLEEPTVNVDIVEMPESIVVGEEIAVEVEVESTYPDVVEVTGWLELRESDGSSEAVDTFSGKEFYQPLGVDIEEGRHTKVLTIDEESYDDIAFLVGSNTAKASVRAMKKGEILDEDTRPIEIEEQWSSIEIVDMPDSVIVGEEMDVEIEIEMSKPEREVYYWWAIVESGADTGPAIDIIDETLSAGTHTKTLTLEEDAYEEYDTIEAGNTYKVRLVLDDGDRQERDSQLFDIYYRLVVID